jgi:hypothetical protein
MSKQPFPLKNRLVVEAIEKFNGNQKKLHSLNLTITVLLCETFFFDFLSDKLSFVLGIVSFFTNQLSTIFRNIQIFLVFISMFSISGKIFF